MVKINNSVIFYSKSSNLVLAEKIRKTLKALGIHTIYAKEIDDIILKTYSTINFLILDFTNSVLDARSLELLEKLKKIGYIKEILVVEDLNKICTKMFDSLKFDSDFCKNLEKYFEEKKFIFTNNLKDKSWISIVGEYLIDIGISPRLSGYPLLVDAIIYFLNNNFVVRSMASNLYPYLANKYQITIVNVEMCLRTAITRGFKNTKFNGFFKNCPSNKEFINFATTQVYDKICLKNLEIG